MERVDCARRAVLIDLDGTLVDTAPDIVEAVSRMLLELGAAPLPFETVSSFIGKGVPNLVRQVAQASALAPARAGAALELFQRHYRDTNGRFGLVFPGVREGLQSLRHAGYWLGCVTNKPHAPAALLLEMHGLAGYLDVLVGGDSVARMKPDPEPLLHACRSLRTRADRCVLVGDSPVDVAAAKAARMPVYIVRYGYPGPAGHDAMEYAALIDSIADLPPLLPARASGAGRFSMKPQP